jgi:serine protease Do
VRFGCKAAGIFTAQATSTQTYNENSRMIVKTIGFFLFSVGLLVYHAGSIQAIQDQQIYLLPGVETEEVVSQWLLRMGYHLDRTTTDGHGVRLLAQKGHRRWSITLWPHSPLATKVKATYAVDGKPDPSQLHHLWTLLGDHTQSIMGDLPEDPQTMPEAILSKSESVVCIYTGYPEKPMRISGFIIDTKGLIACTAHGLSNIRQSITVVLHDGRELPGRVVKLDKSCDLSLVDVNTELHTSVLLLKGRDLCGETEILYNVVCKPQSESFITSGMVSGSLRRTGNQLLWQVNMQIFPGSSGSPVFDSHGNLVAVVKGRYRDSGTVGFLIPFGSLMKFLGDYPK